MRMPFGKYRDEDITDVPEQYLLWLEQQNITEDLRDAINAELDRKHNASHGRPVKLITREQINILREFNAFVGEKISTFNFLGKTNTEVKARINIWLDQFLKGREIVNGISERKS